MIRVYLSKYTREHPIVTLYANKISAFGGFWISSILAEKSDNCLLLIDADEQDFKLIDNQPYLVKLPIVDLRTNLTQIMPQLPASVAIDFGVSITAETQEQAVNEIIKKFIPNFTKLKFDSKPAPTGTFTDDFTGTNGDLLESRSGWTLTTDGEFDAKIYNNALTFRIGTGSGNSAWTCTDQGSANQYVQAYDGKFGGSETLNYLTVRMVDEANFIGYHLGGTGAAGARLCKKVAGSLTDSIIATQGGAGYGFKIECDGNDVSFYRDTGGGFAQVGITQTITDHNTETSAGFVSGYFTGDFEKFDNFENGISGGALITATTGAIEVTGVAASVSAGISFEATCGAVSIVSFNPDVSQTVAINSLVGALAVVGFDAQVSVGNTISSSSGVLTVSGYNPEVSNSLVISCYSGALSVSGFNVAVSEGVTLEATAGSVSVAGYNPDISNDNSITATSGAIAVSGYTAQVSCGVTFSATAGSVSIAGFDADVSNQLTIDCSTGAVFVAGYNPEVLAGISIGATLGHVSVSGSQATVSSGTTLEATQGAVAVSGYNPEISVGVLIEPTTGLVTIIGLESSVTASNGGITVSCTVESISIEGFSCSVSLLSTPATRTNTIAYEDRTNTIAYEDRTNTITA